jgi:hypothetical protein
MWLGEDDPVLTMETARQGDAKLQAKAATLAAIGDLFGFGEDRARTVGQMIEAIDPSSVSLKALLNAPFNPEPKQKALADALMMVARQGKEISPQRLGYWLRQAKGQIVNGLRLCGKLDRTKVMGWWVEKAAGKASAGDAGDCR